MALLNLKTKSYHFEVQATFSRVNVNVLAVIIIIQQEDNGENELKA